MTIEAYAVLQAADVVICDRILPAQLHAAVPAGAVLYVAEKIPGQADIAQAELCSWGIAALRSGRRVVRLKASDVTALPCAWFDSGWLSRAPHTGPFSAAGRRPFPMGEVVRRCSFYRSQVSAQSSRGRSYDIESTSPCTWLCFRALNLASSPASLLLWPRPCLLASP